MSEFTIGFGMKAFVAHGVSKYFGGASFFRQMLSYVHTVRMYLPNRRGRHLSPTTYSHVALLIPSTYRTQDGEERRKSSSISFTGTFTYVIMTSVRRRLRVAPKRF